MKFIRTAHLVIFVTIALGLASTATAQIGCPSNASISLSPTPQSVAASGGAGTFTVSITPGCAFTPGGGTSWLSITGSSATTISYSAAANLDLCQRSGTITGTITTNEASASGTVNQAASAGDFSISVTPFSQSVTQAGSVSYSVLINRTGGFSGNVALSASGMGSGVTASFSNQTASSATLTLAATRLATTGSFQITVSGTNACVRRDAPPVTLIVNPRPWQAADITVLAGAPIVASGTHLGGHINTIAANPNVDELFNFDPNLHMDSPWWNWSWHVSDLSGLVAAPTPVSGSPITDHVNTIANDDEVFYFDTNQHLDSFWWDGNIWHISDITGAAGAPAADAGSAVTGHINTRGNTDEVFYLCAGGHLCGPWWTSTDWQWHSADITILAGCCVPIMQGSALSSHFDSVGNVDVVFYQLPDQRIISNWWDGTWHATDVTTSAGAPLGAAGTSLSSHDNTVANSNEVYFIASDGHLDELWWQPYQWHTSDVTAITGAPLPAPGSQVVSFMNTLDSFDEVFYVGSDQHIYLLWWDGSNWTWHFADLTAAAGAPLAAPGTALNSHFNTVANTEEVYYIGTDQHIKELWR